MFLSGDQELHTERFFCLSISPSCKVTIAAAQRTFVGPNGSDTKTNSGVIEHIPGRVFTAAHGKEGYLSMMQHAVAL